MAERPTFFVPNSKAGKEEELYARYAKVCNASVPALDTRIYSVGFRHDGVEWIATVGETLIGTGIRTVGRGRQKREYPTSHSDPATVQAIFAGSPTYMAVTDGFRTRWANPFLIGEPHYISYFPTETARAATSAEEQ